MIHKRPLGVKVLIPIQILLALIAIPSGALLLYAPSGEAIGAQTILPHLSEQLPFIHDFTLVGTFLILIYGVLPIIFALGLWKQKRLAWIFTLLLGITEMVWIGAEIVLFYDFGFFFFYPIIAGMGVATVILAMLPSVRKFYSGLKYSAA